MFRWSRGRPLLCSSLALLVLAVSTVTHSAEPLAKGAGKFLGNITARWNPPDKNNFVNYWNQVTPENEGKWGNIERTQNKMDWSGLDSSYAFAKRNKLPFKQHTFIWGNQEPSWIGKLSKEEQLKEIKELIRLFAERYPDVDYIDVVNEPINHPASYIEALGGKGETGYDWVIRAFEEVRAVLPKAKLFINEYHVIENSGPTETMIYIVNLLKQRGLIDGIGLQSHFFSYVNTSPVELRGKLDKLAATGVPLYSSEFDITGSDTVQLILYQTFFPVFWEHPGVHGITLWGWIQGQTWDSNTHLIRRDGTERPALTWLKEYMGTHKDVVATAPGTIAINKTLPQRATINGRLLRVTLPEDGTYTLSCTNLLGSTVATWPTHYYRQNTSLMMHSKLPAGIYIVSAVTSNTFTTTCPLVVKDR